jgi:NhaP-type Na+/H+ or K+/H+ antiporter
VRAVNNDEGSFEMETKEFRRSVRSVLEALVLTSGAVATAFGIAAAAHMMFGAVQLVVSFVAA